MIHDDKNCLLGEGAFWHPERGQLFWFDIYARHLCTKGHHWSLPWSASSMAWVDRDRLILHSDRGLHLFDLGTGQAEDLMPFEADEPRTRANDGRADPYGGFWISTMDKAVAEPLGGIHRYYRGEVRRLFAPIAIPNAICFAPDGTTAYFTDTGTQVIRKVRLDGDGWPVGEPEAHVDLRGTDLMPDGAVVAADGTLWCAQWGASRVAVYDLTGKEVGSHAFPAIQTSCPAFGGPDLTDLYCTSAAAGLPQGHLADHPDEGRTFVLPTGRKGQAEHRVILG
jgi:sugar lactone lactonase YvrE